MQTKLSLTCALALLTVSTQAITYNWVPASGDQSSGKWEVQNVGYYDTLFFNYSGFIMFDYASTPRFTYSEDLSMILPNGRFMAGPVDYTGSDWGTVFTTFTTDASGLASWIGGANGGIETRPVYSGTGFFLREGAALPGFAVPETLPTGLALLGVVVALAGVRRGA